MIIPYKYCISRSIIKVLRYMLKNLSVLGCDVGRADSDVSEDLSAVIICGQAVKRREYKKKIFLHCVTFEDEGTTVRSKRRESLIRRHGVTSRKMGPQQCNRENPIFQIDNFQIRCGSVLKEKQGRFGFVDVIVLRKNMFRPLLWPSSGW